MEINVGKLPFDLDFHPSSPLVSVGLITGDLHLYRYAADSQPQRLLEIRAHSESCRAVRFIDAGRAILTGSPDSSILATDVETGATIARLEDAHGAAVNRLINLTETTVASGDDEGCIKVWDTRQRSCCNSFDVHEDYISDMTFAADSMKLLGTSGDGTLSVCSLRKNKVLTQSEFSEDEPLSVVIMKNGRKVICGTQNGVLLLYSWGYFKDCSDRFTGLQSNSIDVLLKLNEDTVITGSENGLISLVGILPNRIIQPIAEHSEYPVERLAFSHDRKFLGSISHDQMLKLWDLDDLLEGFGNNQKSQSVAADSDSDSDEMDLDVKPSKSSKGMFEPYYRVFPCKFSDLLVEWTSNAFNSRKRFLWGILPSAIAWGVWKERNNRVFSSKTRSSHDGFLEIMGLLYLWSNQNRDCTGITFKDFTIT